MFALAGRVNNTGLIEVPMGIPLREIIFEIGGGIPDGRGFKAVQTGGPSGGCIPAGHLDLPVDYESLAKVGSIMGSGGMIVTDDGSCMVDVAKFFIEFCMSESCGKCVPCRVGTTHMYHLLERICSGDAEERDLATLEELCDVVRNTSLCGLGQSAPNPILSTLHYFRDEYQAHVAEQALSRRGLPDGGPGGEGMSTAIKTLVIDGHDVSATAGPDHSRGGPRARHLHSRRCATCRACMRSAPAACAWWR